MLQRAASEVQAANGALVRIGEAPLVSLDEDTLAARTIRAHFGAVRDALLRKHPWNFARRWLVLSQDPAAPAGAFSKGYPLPADCLRVIGVKDASENDWCVEEGPTAPEEATAPLRATLYTDIPAPNICYTRIAPSVGQWDPLFLEVFELELCGKIGGVFGLSQTELEAYEAKAARRLASARRIDEREAARSSLNRAMASYLGTRL